MTGIRDLFDEAPAERGVLPIDEEDLLEEEYELLDAEPSDDCEDPDELPPSVLKELEEEYDDEP